MYTATFTMTALCHGSRIPLDPVTVTDDNTEYLAIIGVRRAMERAGDHAFTLGACEVVHVETGRTWTVTVTEGK